MSPKSANDLQRLPSMSQCIGLNILPKHSELVKSLYKMAANQTCQVNDMTRMLKANQAQLKPQGKNNNTSQIEILTQQPH